MASSRSQTRSRPDAFSSPAKGRTGSPPRRRVTRSQSRDLQETSVLQINNTPNRPSALHAGQKKWGQTLSTVVEESHLRSPPKLGFGYGNSVVPESPEDVANISGTTILPSEPETDLEPEMMLEALPDLERAGKNVLDFLVPSSSDPVSIVNSVKRLGDPRNTQNRRLGRLMSNLSSESRYFGNLTYINAEHVAQLFSSALANRHRGFQKRWSPSPILHLANCAQFSFQILLAGIRADSHKQAIRDVENLFPLPFMDNFANDNLNKTTGESLLAKDTFDLALEIRTQSLIILLEDHQKDPDFNPMTAVRHCFFVDLSVDAPLRGFNLPSLKDSNGNLPDRYKDAVKDRFDEILLSQVDDGSIDIEELKGAYRWQRFVLRATQWVRKRSEEISRALKQQMTAQDVHEAFFNAKPPSFDSTVGGSDMGAEPSPVVPEPERELAASPDHLNETSAVLTGQERRRSSKPSFLNTSSIQRILQRQERLRSVTAEPGQRRQSDIARPASQKTSEQSTSNSNHRRQTFPAAPLERPTQPDKPREIPESPNASPLLHDDPLLHGDPLLHDEPEITIGDETHLTFGENETTQVERSHSPPVIGRRTPQLQQGNQTIDSVPGSSQEVWNAIKNGPLRQSTSAAGRNSRTAFIDRQSNAHRVSPISQEVESQSAVTRVEARVSRKRARQVAEEESDSDNQFSYFDRATDVARRRAEKPDQPGSKRQRIQTAGEEESPEDANSGQPGHPSPPRRRVAWVSTNTGRESVSSIQSSQTHLRWTTAEDNRLVRLIKEFGCSWAQIERQNEAQPRREGEVRIEGRNQVQLKDRARNLKIKYIRESVKLPKNFDKVTMKAKDYDMLESRGLVVPRP